jgi:putative sterol carrier protein
VPTFLTSAWFAALDAEARRHAATGSAAEGERVVLGQEVHGTPNGLVRYQLVVDGSGVQVLATAEGPADLTFVCDYATAVALAQGTTNAQEALMAGRLQVRGDVERFAAARDALLAVGDVFARVRDTTDY